MEGKNPCDVCERKNFASGCSGCVLDTHDATCNNYDCFLQYEDSCLLWFGKSCKASTEYADNHYDHDCDECEDFRNGADGLYYCENTGEEVTRWQTACEDFKERIEE